MNTIMIILSIYLIFVLLGFLIMCLFWRENGLSLEEDADLEAWIIIILCSLFGSWIYLLLDKLWKILIKEIGK